MWSVIRILYLLTLIGTAAKAETTVKEYRSTISSKDQAKIAFTKLYVTGIAAGILAANARLDTLNQNLLYCPPESLVLNTDNYLDILEREITTLSKRGMPIAMLDDMPISFVILGSLQENFPCRSK